ncbi:hypothetical protein MTO96_018617 [Rhipicephalus appendiculatus]
MSPRMLVALLALVFVACLGIAGWYTVRLVVAVLSVVGPFYAGVERDHCDCVQDDVAVLRNASLAQCVWVQATLLRERAADALAASGLSHWLKRCDKCEWFLDFWVLLVLVFSLCIARWRRSRRGLKGATRVGSLHTPRCAAAAACKQHPLAYAIPSTSEVFRRHVTPSLPAPPASTTAGLRTTSTPLPRRAECARRLSGCSSHSWPPSRRRGPESRPVPFGLPHLAPASKWVFGELLQECRHGASVTFDLVLKEIGARACIKLSESPDSELFCVVGNWRRSVIKVLRFEYVVRHRDLVLAELRVGRALQSIAANLQTSTAGLSRLRTAYCVWGKYPELLTSACRSFRERKSSGFVSDDGHDLSLPYVVLHMTFAGWPLSSATLESPLQLWSVVQQVALTLAVAEEALEFEHRALSEDHVLVKKAHHDVLSYRLNGRVLHVNTFGVHAFLVDFCASRLRPRGDVKPLFTDLKKMPRNKCDAMGGDVLEDLQPRRTNVAALEGLTRSLAKRFESRFAAAVDEAEQEAWCDLCFWLDEMPYCASATELALQMAM